MKAALSSDFVGTGWSGSGVLELCAGVFSNRPQVMGMFVVKALQMRQDFFYGVSLAAIRLFTQLY